MDCVICSKKLSLAQQQMICKCKIKMCPKCKQKHQCNFDYKSEFKEKLKKQLVKLTKNKITPI